MSIPLVKWVNIHWFAVNFTDSFLKRTVIIIISVKRQVVILSARALEKSGPTYVRKSKYDV